MAEPKFYVRLAGEATFDLHRVRGRGLRGKLLAVARQYDAEVRPLPWHLEEVGHLWDAGCSNDTPDLSFRYQTSDFVGALRRAELEARTEHTARSALPDLQRMSAGGQTLSAAKLRSRLWRTKPTSMVGRLIASKRLPASLRSSPYSRTRISSSPLATPRSEATTLIANPAIAPPTAGWSRRR
jgi:hypothetical protein